jgi:peptidoglycan/LPS O-acetylase OafA/YrhL
MPSGAVPLFVGSSVDPAPATLSRRSVRDAAPYYPAFDWLRIALAVMVMMHHAELFPWGKLGHFRVQVFFALSGWLIGRTLLRTTSAELPRFFFGRVLRIWIPYALALLWLLGISLLHDRVTAKYLEIVLYKLTFVYNLFGTGQLAQYEPQMPLQGAGNHFWSVCAEEQFYLCAPLLLLRLPRLGRSPWLWLGIALTGVFSAIALGVAASLAHARWGALQLRPGVRAILLSTLLASTSAIWLGASYEAWSPWLAISLVLLLARPGSKTQLGEFLGGMSYQLYLNHWVGLFVAHAVAARFGLGAPAATVYLGFPLSLLLAATLYTAVDKRVLANREVWYAPQRARAAMIAAYATTGIGLLSAAVFQLLGT